jgi:hypothetical protein
VTIPQAQDLASAWRKFPTVRMMLHGITLALGGERTKQDASIAELNEMLAMAEAG